MEQKHAKFDPARAWSDAMRMLGAEREILLTMTGALVMLPMLLLDMLRPFTTGDSRAATLADLMRWTEANALWILLATVVAALGRLAILILLLSPERPTVGEALSAAARLLIPFVVMDVLVGLMWLGGSTLLLLPGLYLVGRTYLAEAAFVAGRVHNPMAAIAAGFERSRGNGWRIFAMVAIIYVAGTVLTAAIGSVVGVIGALIGAAGLDGFLNAFVESALGSALSLMLLLVSIASWRQLDEERHVRSGVTS